jgi:Pyridoxamine 5'-phosphate oxidase
MDPGAHAYTLSLDASRQLPPALQQYLDGTGLLGKTQALRLATVDAAGWPHAALLSAGDALAVSAQKLRFALFAQSQTAANLARDGRLVLTLVLDRGLCEVRLQARRLAPDDGPLALFEGTVEAVRHHAAPYADVTGGITFSLHQPDAVQARWQRQIAALKAAA